MWQIIQPVETIFPPITYEGILCLALVLILVRWLLQKILERYMNVSNFYQSHDYKYTDHNYFYHFAIVVLVLGPMKWNSFDFWIWSCTYLGIGLIRRSIELVTMQREKALNDNAFNKNLIPLLSASKIFGLLLLFGSTVYLIIINIFLQKMPSQVTNMLMFPPIMLVIDSLFFIFKSWTSYQELINYYNLNINQLPQKIKLSIMHDVCSNTVRTWHWITVSIYNIKNHKSFFLGFIWKMSISYSLLNSLSFCWESIKKFILHSRLVRHFNRMAIRQPPNFDQNCVICMSQLLNCRRLATCGHLFHYRCLFQWIQVKNDCPICRTPLIFPN